MLACFFRDQRGGTRVSLLSAIAIWQHQLYTKFHHAFRHLL